MTDRKMYLGAVWLMLHLKRTNRYFLDDGTNLRVQVDVVKR